MVGLADVAGLEGGNGIFALELVEGGVIGAFGIEDFELLAESVGFEAEGLAFAVAGEKDEEKWADNRETDDDESPEQAHFGDFVIVDDVEGDSEGEKDGEDGDGEEVAIEEEIEDDKDEEFGENAKDGPSEAVSEEAFEEAKGVMLVLLVTAGVFG